MHAPTACHTIAPPRPRARSRAESAPCAVLHAHAGNRLNHAVTGSEVDGERLGAASIAQQRGAIVVLPQATGDDYCQVGCSGARVPEVGATFLLLCPQLQGWRAAARLQKVIPQSLPMHGSNAWLLANARLHSAPMQAWNVTFWTPRSILPACAVPTTDDAALLAALVTKLPQRLGADPGRVYLSGFSNGAMLVQEMLCRHPQAARALRETGYCGANAAANWLATNLA